MNDQPKPAFRTFVNPARRAEIPPGFPAHIYAGAYTFSPVAEALKKEFAKRGLDFSAPRRITIAYPHKHPGLFRDYKDTANAVVRHVVSAGRREMPQFEWITAGGIVDTVHLDRSGRQSALHALTGRQVYDFHPESQAEYLPFADPANKEKELFLLVDTTCEQGTTMMNLMSFLKENGADVLGAALSHALASEQFVQRRAAVPEGMKLAPCFTSPNRNNGRAPDLAAAFAKSASRAATPQNWSPGECLDRFEAALYPAGNSLFALTEAECNRLIETVSGNVLARGAREMSFPYLLEQIDAEVDRRKWLRDIENQRRSMHGKPPLP
jgi:hypothetical protein